MRNFYIALVCIAFSASLQRLAFAHDDEDSPRNEAAWEQFSRIVLKKGQRHLEAMRRWVAICVAEREDHPISNLIDHDA
jgi:hypothetical protein